MVSTEVIHFIILALLLVQAIAIYLLASRCTKELTRYAQKIDSLDKKMWTMATENYRLKLELKQYIRNIKWKS